MNTNFRYIIILLLANLLFLSSEANGQNLSPASGEINGHQWVDLGLPSGLKWATCGKGARVRPSRAGGSRPAIIFSV